MEYLLVAGGILTNPALLRAKLEATQYDVILAVDRGYDHCQALGLVPDLLLGDLDSVAQPSATESTDTFGCKVIQFVPEKDETDLRLAVDYAVAHGAAAIDIICATGGRLDQFMGNLSLLEYLHEKNNTLTARIIDEINCIQLITGRSEYQNSSKYISIVPITERIVFSCEGLKYPAKQLTVLRTNMVSISNECLGSTFTVELHSGKALLIQAE